MPGAGAVAWLNLMCSMLPPHARILIANAVTGWADRVRREAMAELGMDPNPPPPAPEEQPRAWRGTVYDTTGQTRPF